MFAAAVYVAGKTAIRRGPFYPVTATAVGRRVFQHLSGGDSYYIEFRYTARDGLSRRGSAGVSKNGYLSSKTGDQIPVSVSEAHPDEVWPVAENSPTYLVTALVIFLGACFFVPGVILGGGTLRRIVRAVAALEKGQYIVGRVEKIVPAHQRLNGRLLYCVAWTWLGRDGAPRRAKSPSLSWSDANHWKPGDEIAAYVHPADPEFAEADVYGLRKGPTFFDK